ncbi:MAG: hypothetical protein ACK56I_36245, partial [bacterium]
DETFPAGAYREGRRKARVAAPRLGRVRNLPEEMPEGDGVFLATEPHSCLGGIGDESSWGVDSQPDRGLTGVVQSGNTMGSVLTVQQLGSTNSSPELPRNKTRHLSCRAIT